jgi:hypothetical protein
MHRCVRVYNMCYQFETTLIYDTGEMDVSNPSWKRIWGCLRMLYTGCGRPLCALGLAQHNL